MSRFMFLNATHGRFPTGGTLTGYKETVREYKWAEAHITGLLQLWKIHSVMGDVSAEELTKWILMNLQHKLRPKLYDSSPSVMWTCHLISNNKNLVEDEECCFNQRKQNATKIRKLVKCSVSSCSRALWTIHYIDVIMTTVASQITSVTVVNSIVYSRADQRKHQSSTSLAFVRGIHRDWWIPRTKGW